MIRVLARTSPADRERYAQASIRAAGRAAEREARQMAVEMRIELNRLLEADFRRRGPDERKRGTTHLHNMFRVVVEPGDKPGGFPYRVAITTNRNLTDDELAKVFSLMNGSRPHDIEPRLKKALSWTSPSGGTVVVSRVGKPVTKQHPGQRKGKDTLRRARNNVVARRRRSRV